MDHAVTHNGSKISPVWVKFDSYFIVIVLVGVRLEDKFQRHIRFTVQWVAEVVNDKPVVLT